MQALAIESLERGTTPFPSPQLVARDGHFSPNFGPLSELDENDGEERQLVPLAQGWDRAGRDGAGCGLGAGYGAS
jgi:hypothetical protein